MKQSFFKRTTVSTTSNNWPLILQALADLTEDQVNTLADSLKTLCPLCNRRSSYVFKGGEDGNWSCLHCGEGDGWTLLQKVNDWDFTVAVNEINSFVCRGAILPVLTRKPRPPKPDIEHQDSIRGWIDRFNQEPRPLPSELPSELPPESLSELPEQLLEQLPEPPKQLPEPSEPPPELSEQLPKLKQTPMTMPPAPLIDSSLAEPIVSEEASSSSRLVTPKPNSRQTVGYERDRTIIRRFSAQTVGQLIQDIQPTRWLITDFLEHAALAQFSAPPASGKSFLAVDIAACVATGKDFHGLSTRQGLVFYLPGNGLTDMKKRFRAWEIHNETSIERTPLFLLPKLSDMALSVYFTDAEDEMERVVRTRNLTPKLIIIDTSAHHHASSGDEMTLVAARAKALQRKFGCCVLLTGDSWTISRVLLDAEYQILRRKEGSVITVQPVKMRDGELAAPMDLALIPTPIGLQSEDGRQITCAVLAKTDHSAITTDHPVDHGDLTAMDGRKRTGRPLTQAQETVLRAICTRAAISGQAPYQAVLDDIKSQGGAVSSYARTVNALIQRNLVTMTGDDLMPVVEILESDDSC